MNNDTTEGNQGDSFTRNQDEKPAETSVASDQQTCPPHLPGWGAVPAPIPANEEARLSRLHEFDILDTKPDVILEGVTELAAFLCDTPIAVISLVDRTRQWFLATHGMEVKETPRDVAFCAYAILDPKEPFIVPDTLKDPRFVNNPLVTGPPFIRFYAGFPIASEKSLPLGSFCVIDRKPRELSGHQLEMLGKLTKIAFNLMEVHRSNAVLKQLVHMERDVYSRLIQFSTQLVEEKITFDDAMSALVSDLDPKLGWLSARVRNMQTGASTGIHNNAMFPESKSVDEIWRKIDRNFTPPSKISASSEYVSLGPLQPEFSHITVPVRIGNCLVGLIEFIYPDHLIEDPRIKEVFDLMAANLSMLVERELHEVELRRQASHDPLTGAANRALLEAEMEKVLRQCNSTLPCAALLYMNVDEYTEVKGSLGHSAADSLLIEVAKRLQGICRPNDVLCRLSGDEFVILARDLKLATDNDLLLILNRVKRAFHQPLMVEGREMKIHLPIGCVIIAEPIMPAEVIERGEAALHITKQNKPREFTIADAEMLQALREQKVMERQLKRSLESNNLFLVGQPIFDLKENRPCGAEVLLRLRMDDGSVMPAAQFMESVSRMKIFGDLDEKVFAQSLRVLTETARPLLSVSDFKLSINMNFGVLCSEGHAESLLSQLKSSKVSPRNITLEILESQFPLDNGIFLENLNIIRSAGVSVAIDDFGTGFSNLERLALLPIDSVKIDKSLLSGITTGDPRSIKLLASVVAIAKSLGYDIVAEGVETEAQAEHVRSLGCRYVQGFHFARPMPFEELVDWWNSIRPMESAE